MKEIVSFGSSPEQTRFRELVARLVKVLSIDAAWNGAESSTSTGDRTLTSHRVVVGDSLGDRAGLYWVHEGSLLSGVHAQRSAGWPRNA